MLENGADFYRELLAAFIFVAFPEADAGLPLALAVAAIELGRVGRSRRNAGKPRHPATR